MGGAAPAALAAKAEFRLWEKPQVQPREERQTGVEEAPHLGHEGT